MPHASRAHAPEHCTRARACAPHGIAAPPAQPDLSPAARRRLSGTAVADAGPATMRALAAGLLSLALAAPALAGSRCGDDVAGRSVPCDCGDVLVSSRTLGDADPITTRTCPATGLVIDVPAGQQATLALGGHN